MILISYAESDGLPRCEAGQNIPRLWNGLPKLGGFFFLFSQTGFTPHRLFEEGQADIHLVFGNRQGRAESDRVFATPQKQQPGVVKIIPGLAWIFIPVLFRFSGFRFQVSGYDETPLTGKNKGIRGPLKFIEGCVDCTSLKPDTWNLKPIFPRLKNSAQIWYHKTDAWMG